MVKPKTAGAQSSRDSRSTQLRNKRTVKIQEPHDDIAQPLGSLEQEAIIIEPVVKINSPIKPQAKMQPAKYRKTVTMASRTPKLMELQKEAKSQFRSSPRKTLVIADAKGGIINKDTPSFA
mmetsp:Transcript_33616/g.51792  ORF Transcript_33616/g.51792 Transcript_33616/m.51792 type:complete len:121 (-) Transcript_33616:4520-4882(-)